MCLRVELEMFCMANLPQVYVPMRARWRHSTRIVHQTSHPCSDSKRRLAHAAFGISFVKHVNYSNIELLSCKIVILLFCSTQTEKYSRVI